MIIVSNTSPLSSLAKIDRLILLKQIYRKIIIPQAIFDELMDVKERLGRKESKRLKLSITGLLGVLLIAKKRGLISQVKVVMDELIDQTSFRIGSQLYKRVLREVKETNE